MVLQLSIFLICVAVLISGRNNMGGTASSRLTTAFYGSNPDATGAVGGTQTKTLVV
jgi:hypothetical protein